MIIPFNAAVVCADPYSYRIVQMMFQEGRFWHQKRVMIPASAIVNVTEEVITVSLKRHGIDALSVHRPAAFFPFIQGKREGQARGGQECQQPARFLWH